MMKFKKVRLGIPVPTDSHDAEAFVTECGIGVIKTIDRTPKWGDLKHVSISKEDRYPTWEEILEVKEHFFGDVDCMMVMPKKEDYVNIHRNCFHVWQMPEGWGIQ